MPPNQVIRPPKLAYSLLSICLMYVHAWFFEACTVKKVLLHTGNVFKSFQGFMPPNQVTRPPKLACSLFSLCLMSAHAWFFEIFTVKKFCFIQIVFSRFLESQSANRGIKSPELIWGLIFIWCIRLLAGIFDVCTVRKVLFHKPKTI